MLVPQTMTNRYKLLSLVFALLLIGTIGSPAFAQSDTDSEVVVNDEPTGAVDDAQEEPVEVGVSPVEDAPATAVASPLTELQATARAKRYLASINSIGMDLSRYELHAVGTLNDYRLGALTRPRAENNLRLQAKGAARVETNIQKLVVPPQFAEVQDLYASAAAETRMAMQLTSDNFEITPLAALHFDQSYRLVAAAQLTLDQIGR